MKFLKKYEAYSADPTVKPAPVKPTTKPGTTPSRPSPLRRDKPSVEPAPKAWNPRRNRERKNMPMASVEDVIQRYIDETSSNENNLTQIDPKEELRSMFSNENWFHSVQLQGQRNDYKLVIYTKRPLNESELSSIPNDINGIEVITSTNKTIR